MASIATVTVRDFAILDANTPPPMSIWLSSQPPKISPLALVSAGIATVRVQRSPPGSVSLFGGARVWVSVILRLQERSTRMLHTDARDHAQPAPLSLGNRPSRAGQYPGFPVMSLPFDLVGARHQSGERLDDTFQRAPDVQAVT